VINNSPNENPAIIKKSSGVSWLQKLRPKNVNLRSGRLIRIAGRPFILTHGRRKKMAINSH
jgi:hypothetical protein